MALRGHLGADYRCPGMDGLHQVISLRMAIRIISASAYDDAICINNLFIKPMKAVSESLDGRLALDKVSGVMRCCQNVAVYRTVSQSLN